MSDRIKNSLWKSFKTETLLESLHLENVYNDELGELFNEFGFKEMCKILVNKLNFDSYKNQVFQAKRHYYFCERLKVECRDVYYYYHGELMFQSYATSYFGGFENNKGYINLLEENVLNKRIFEIILGLLQQYKDNY